MFIIIINISDRNFKNIMREDFMQLPKRWDGYDFFTTIDGDLFAKYQEKVKAFLTKKEVNIVRSICNYIAKSIDLYNKGYPEKAYRTFSRVMNILLKNPVKIYQKSGWIGAFEGEDPLKLFRIRNVQNNTLYYRSDIFHTPYNLRSKVSSCRYSIAGYPSLYLGTSLTLCSEEAKVESLKDLRLAARFELVRNGNESGKNIKVIELGVKPQDFLSEEFEIQKNLAQGYYSSERNFKSEDLSSVEVRSNYLRWYPLIAACSFMRVNKGDPFASEYIIPQLLMQWIRTKFTQEELYGIRYFSCASYRASEMGFNYVFPVSGEKYDLNPKFCSGLAKAFILTGPKFIHESVTISDCEKALIADRDLRKIERKL